jgi:hypothetical protein
VRGTTVPSRSIHAQQASRSAGEPFAHTVGAPVSSATTTLIRLRTDSKGHRCRRVAAAVKPARSASTRRAASVGSPTRVVRAPSRSTRALLQCRAQASRACTARSAARAAGETGAPSRRKSAVGACPSPRTVTTAPSIPAVRSATTVARFCVRVPVLSEQMTVVQPRVSTLSRSLTRAPRFAIRDTPTARASVTVGSSPSGTLATKIPIQNTKACAKLRWATRHPMRRKVNASSEARAAMENTVARSWRLSGLTAGAMRAVSAAMRPISVDIPVPNTTARARPRKRVVPREEDVGQLDKQKTPVQEHLAVGLVAPRRARLARQRGVVHLDLGGLDEPTVGRHRVALVEQHHVARHERVGGHRVLLSAAHHPALQRQQALQRVDGPVGAGLLEKRHRPVDAHHQEDGPPELRHVDAGHEAQPRRHPEQHREEAEEAPQQPRQERDARGTLDAVGAEVGEAARGFRRVEARIQVGLELEAHLAGGEVFVAGLRRGLAAGDDGVRGLGALRGDEGVLDGGQERGDALQEP